MNRLQQRLRSPTAYVAATALLVPATLTAAYAVMYWSRGIALPLLFLAGTWFWLLRPQGPLRDGERIAVKAWALLVGFFLIGPLVIATFRLALLVLLVLLAFRPGGAP